MVFIYIYFFLLFVIYVEYVQHIPNLLTTIVLSFLLHWTFFMTVLVAINEFVIRLYFQQRDLLIKNAVIFEIHVFKLFFAIVLQRLLWLPLFGQRKQTNDRQWTHRVPIHVVIFCCSLHDFHWNQNCFYRYVKQCFFLHFSINLNQICSVIGVVKNAVWPMCVKNNAWRWFDKQTSRYCRWSQPHTPHSVCAS